MKAKVFIIGLQKTGTTSLREALRMLGYRVRNSLRINDPHAKGTEPYPNLRGKIYLELDEPITQEKLVEAAIPVVPRYDAFKDIPWNILYRGLDKAFHNSRFILSTRAPDAWCRSAMRHFGTRSSTPMLEFIYGSPSAKRDRKDDLMRAYLQHNADVMAYFRERPDDLLVMDTAQFDWPPLCKFLGRCVPLFRSFPHANKAERRERASKSRLKYYRNKIIQFVEDTAYYTSSRS